VFGANDGLSPVLVRGKKVEGGLRMLVPSKWCGWDRSLGYNGDRKGMWWVGENKERQGLGLMMGCPLYL